MIMCDCAINDTESIVCGVCVKINGTCGFGNNKVHSSMTCKFS